MKLLEGKQPFFYNDLKVSMPYGRLDWHTGWPINEYNGTIEYTYYADDDDIIQWLFDTIADDPTTPKGLRYNEDLLLNYIEEHYLDLIEQYYKDLLEYFRDDAEDQAHQTIDIEDYIDED